MSSPSLDAVVASAVEQLGSGDVALQSLLEADLAASADAFDDDSHEPALDAQEVPHAEQLPDDVDEELEAELDVHAQIAMHLNEIQRLRASKAVRGMASKRQSMISTGSAPLQTPPPPTTLRLPSISLQRSAPDVSAVLRTRRTVRTFSQKQHDVSHAHQRSRSAQFPLEMLNQLRAESAGNNSSRREGIPMGHHSEQSFRLGSDDMDEQFSTTPPAEAQRRDGSDVSVVQPADAAYTDEQQEPHHSDERGSLRQRRVRGSPKQSQTPQPRTSKQRAYSVIISGPAAPPPTQLQLRAMKSGLALQIPEHRVSGDDFAVDPNDDDHMLHPHDSPLSSFQLNRRPSMSERLNVRNTLAKSPAHHVARSLMPELTESPGRRQSRHQSSRRNTVHAPPEDVFEVQLQPHREEEADEASDSDSDSDSDSEAEHAAAALAEEGHSTDAEHHSTTDEEADAPHVATAQEPERIFESIFSSVAEGDEGTAASNSRMKKSEPSVSRSPAAPSTSLAAVTPVSDAALATAASPLAEPSLSRSQSLPVTAPLDGDQLLSPTTASSWSSAAARLACATPRILARSMTAAAGLLAVATQGASSPSPIPPAPGSARPSVSSSASPSSASGMSSSAWLDQRMQRMFPRGAPAVSSMVGDGCEPTDFSSRLSHLWRGKWSRGLVQRCIALIIAVLPSTLHVLLPLIVLFQAVTLPMRLAFGSAAPSASSNDADGGSSSSSMFAWWASWDAPLELLIVLGVLCTDYIDVHTRTWRPALRKARSLRASAKVAIAVDIVSSLPFGMLISAETLRAVWSDPSMATPVRVQSLVRLPRLLRLTRLFSSLDALETRNLVDTVVSPTVFRLGKLTAVMYLVAHLAGCGYVFISYVEGLPAENAWCVPSHIRLQPVAAQYLHAIFWGFSSMSGSMPQAPETPLEHLFALGVLLVGISTYATLIGNLSSIIQQLNSKAEDFRDKMTRASELMDTYKLPPDVQQRVKACFQHLFGGGLPGSSGRGSALMDGDDSTGVASRLGSVSWDVLQFLPAYLRNEVLIHINGEIIHKVPLFRGCSDGFMRSLVPLLKPEVIIPGDFIIRASEIGREMYLVRHGQLEVIAHGVVVATLSDGSYVGEVAVMFEQKRTASVRAITFCDILVLSKDDFDGVLSQYPEVQKSMRMQATMRRNARNLQDKELRASELKGAKTPRSAGKTRILVTPAGTTGSVQKSPPTARSRMASLSQPGGERGAPAVAGEASLSPLSALASPRTRSARPSVISRSSTVSSALLDGDAMPVPTLEQKQLDSAAPSSVAAVTPPDGTLLSPSASTQLAVPSGSSGPASDADVTPAEDTPIKQSKWKKLRMLTRGQ